MTASLHTLKAGRGATRKRDRVGRGPGSGSGKTAGRGHKGQRSRAGYSRRAGFEGGQMPLYRRLPKRGFRNIFAKKFVILNVRDLNRYRSGSTVSPESLAKDGVVKKLRDGLRILGHGDLKKKLKVKAHYFTESARKKIEEAGGSCEVIA